MKANDDRSEKKVILVVDDEIEIRVLLCTFLEDLEYEGKMAFDGIDALQRMERETFDLVLTDRRMPRMDGLTLCRRMSLNGAPRIPVLIMTGDGAEDFGQTVAACGGRGVLRKPFELAELREKIEAVIGAGGS